MSKLPTRYRLYIDESGDHTYRHMHKEDRRYLGLTGVILPYSSNYTKFHDELQKLKDKHFPTHPDDPLIFHREDIIQKRKRFVVLTNREKEQGFNVDMLTFIQEQEYIVLSVVIDKKDHQEKYGEAAYHPYHYCLTILLERYCGWLNRTGWKGDVMAEGRGGKEDRLLKDEYSRIHEMGTIFKSPAFFQQALTSKQLKVKKKSKNIAGLQFADLLAHPCKQDILIDQGKIGDKRSSFVKQICNCLNSDHYLRLGNDIWGNGKKFIG